MATDALSYTGINRAYSDFAGSRACEELINLRPATEGVVPVKDFSVKMADVPYRKVFIHYTTSGPKYIIARIGGGDDDDVVVQYIDEQGTVLDGLFITESYGDDTFDSLHFASAGNILLISLCDRTNGVYENSAHMWKGNGYVAWEAEIPQVDMDIDDGTNMISVNYDIPDLDNDSTPGDVVSAVETAMNAVQEKDKRLCVGPIIIALAFKTTDGSTFWTSSWRVYDPVPVIDASPYDSPYKTINDLPERFQTEMGSFFAKYGHGYELYPPTSNRRSVPDVTLYGTHVDVTLSMGTGFSWDKETSAIQSVEVYASKPVPFIDTANANDGFECLISGDVGQPDDACCLIVPQRKYGEMELGGQLLYLQSSVTLESLTEGEQVVRLEFGGNVQVTEDTLDTDAGELKRYGRLLSYNARFHYFDSVSVTKIGRPFFSIAPGGGERGFVFVEYADEDRSLTRYLGYVDDLDHEKAADVVVAPSIRIKDVVTYFVSGSSWYTITYRMEASSSYNYAVCAGDVTYADGTVGSSDDKYGPLVPSNPATADDAILTEEPDAINVTEQYNPFVFLVEHSYKAPGNIIDVQTQMAGITDSSYGRDPLSVFTERGTYALTQGSANVLYGAFLPVSNNVISRGRGSSVPTEAGIFFLADGALWLLSGRRATLVSDALHLGPHKYIRACDGYKRISGVDENYSPAPSGVTITPEYDISPALSEVSFEQFVRTGARLSFNRFRMELLVSNPSYGYTYVLSLKYRQWFKIGRRLWQDEAGSDIACTPGATLGNIDVVDLSTEEATAQVLVHMQTRPFSMGYRYIHMHRIVAMVRARLSGTAGDKLVVGLYGSDDLQEWYLLSYAKRAGGTVTSTDDPPVVTDRPLKVSQIRTSSSSRSWRYYTVCIGGPVPPDADLGPVLVDYQPVVRRIG